MPTTAHSTKMFWRAGLRMDRFRIWHRPMITENQYPMRRCRFSWSYSE
jgi:hypothetical protein